MPVDPNRANTLMAAQWLKQGTALMHKELQAGADAEEVQRKSSVSATIAGQIIPAIERGELKGNDVVKAIDAVSRQYGVDTLDGTKMFNNMFKVAQRGKITMKDLLEEQRLEKGEIDIIAKKEEITRKRVADRRQAIKDATPEAVKAIRKISGEEAPDTLAHLTKIWSIAKEADDFEDLQDKLGDEYEGAEIETGWFERNQATDEVDLAEKLTDYFYNNRIPGFTAPTRDAILTAMRRLVLQPETFNPDNVFLKVVGPKSSGGQAGAAAAERLVERTVKNVGR